MPAVNSVWDPPPSPPKKSPKEGEREEKKKSPQKRKCCSVRLLLKLEGARLTDDPAAWILCYTQYTGTFAHQSESGDAWPEHWHCWTVLHKLDTARCISLVIPFHSDSETVVAAAAAAVAAAAVAAGLSCFHCCCFCWLASFHLRWHLCQKQNDKSITLRLCEYNNKD